MSSGIYLPDTASLDHSMPKPTAIEKAGKPLPGNPPEPAAPKATGKPNPRGPVTKAEHAALKRIDKMVIKRMRKR